MRNSIRYITVIAIIAVTVISVYQGYWLVNVYNTFGQNIRRDIQEGLRAADFEEIVYRSRKMAEENFGGKMDITVDVNPHNEKTTLRNESKRKLSDKEIQTNLDTNVPKQPNFAEALKDEEALTNIGLGLQRGIHSGLDRLRAPYFEHLDKIVSRRLDSLGVTTKHSLLYLQHTASKQGTRTDTLAISGNRNLNGERFTLELDISENTEYVLLVTNLPFVILRKMDATLMASVSTLLLLILAFTYIITMTKRMKDLGEMKTDFMNNITHELKTPIAVAHAANDALLNFEESIDKPTMKSYLKMSLQQLNRLSGLVEQILSLSMGEHRNPKIQIERVEIADVARDLLDIFRMKSQKNVDFRLNIEEGISLNTDRMHFSNIVSNLIDNAIKYSDEHPIVEITARRTHAGTVTLVIKDHGMGIPANRQPYVFDKFYRVPNGNIHDIKGFGLGLFYVKSMVERLGGKVTIESEEGKGSTFTLDFQEKK